MEKAISKAARTGPDHLEGSASALLPSLVKLLWVMKVDRPSSWSPTFEGLSPLDLHIIAFIQAKPDVILKEIRDYLDIPNSTLTGMIDRLEKRGLIERIISSRDRRSYGLKLTEAGAAVRKEQQLIRMQSAANMLKSLDTEEERRAFVNMMNKIGERLVQTAISNDEKTGGM